MDNMKMVGQTPTPHHHPEMVFDPHTGQMLPMMHGMNPYLPQGHPGLPFPPAPLGPYNRQSAPPSLGIQIPVPQGSTGELGNIKDEDNSDKRSDEKKKDKSRS